MDEKIKLLMEIIENISDIYPELDKVIIDNIDAPEYIVIASTDYLENMEELLGMSLIDDLDEYVEEDEPKKQQKKGKIH